MAFYILVKGKIKKHSFDYLENIDPKRLDDTRGPHQSSKVKLDVIDSNVFAIEIMTKGLGVLAPQNFVHEAMEFLYKYNIHHIPLVLENKIIGLVSYNDLKNADSSDRLEKHMVRTILAATEETALRDIIHVFMHENISSVPIVNDSFKVTGIITINDIFKWILKNQKYTK